MEKANKQIIARIVYFNTVGKPDRSCVRWDRARFRNVNNPIVVKCISGLCVVNLPPQGALLRKREAKGIPHLLNLLRPFPFPFPSLPPFPAEGLQTSYQTAKLCQMQMTPRRPSWNCSNSSRWINLIQVTSSKLWLRSVYLYHIHIYTIIVFYFK